VEAVFIGGTIPAKDSTDKIVGRTIKIVDDADQAENTIIVFTGNNDWKRLIKQ